MHLWGELWELRRNVYRLVPGTPLPPVLVKILKGNELGAVECAESLAKSWKQRS